MTTTRRKFLSSISMLAASTALPLHSFAFGKTTNLKIALVGIGVRGITFWGKRLVETYPDILEFVGLSDIDPSRLAYGRNIF